MIQVDIVCIQRISRAFIPSSSVRSIPGMIALKNALVMLEDLPAMFPGLGSWHNRTSFFGM